MRIETYIEIGLLVLSILLSFSLIVYLLIRGKRTKVFYSFIAVQIVILIWSSGLIFEVFSLDRDSKWIIVRIEYLAVSLIGLSWLMFSLYYTDSKFLKNKKALTPIFVLPLIFYLLVSTNDYHNMFYTEFQYDYRIYGVFFWCHVLMEYVYIFSGTILIIKYSLGQLKSQKVQSVLVIFSSLIPIVSNFIYVFRIIKLHIDITPISFSISMILFTIAIFKFRFLDMVSIGLKAAVDNMMEPIIIVDNFDKIVDFNKAFIYAFGYGNKVNINDDIHSFTEKLKNKLCSSYNMLKVIEGKTEKAISIEVTLNMEKLKYYCVNVQPIYNSRNAVLGRVITFNDITEYKNLMEALDKKNNELLNTNEKLKGHLTTAAELASEKERNRIAQEVHDTLGHTMTLLIALLEVCKITYKEDSIKTEKSLSEALDTARSGLRGLRESIIRIKAHKMKSENFISDLKEMIACFELTGIKVELVVDRIDNMITSNDAEVLYRICKEALTNSLRHGKANQVSIILKVIDEKIKLFILDDGLGCAFVKKGLGLSGMEERVREVNGSIAYGSDGEKGFNIHIEIPIGGDSRDDKNYNSR